MTEDDLKFDQVPGGSWTTDKLRPYQEVAVEFLKRNRRSVLMLDMGLGKTCVALTALQPKNLPALVVAPKRVAESVWHVEQERWRPDLTTVVAKGTPKHRQAAYARILNVTADIMTISWDNFHELGDDHPFKTIIIDELSGFKNYQTERFKSMRRLANPATGVRTVWGLTGTPSANGLLDLWGQFKLLDDGVRLGKNITAYRTKWFYPAPGKTLPNGVITQWDLRPGAEQEIRSKIEDISLAMSTEGRVPLPKVSLSIVPVELPSRARRAYNEMKKDLLTDIRDVMDGEIYTAESAGQLSNRLRQLTAGFMYGDRTEEDRSDRVAWVHKTKIAALEEVFEEAQGSPVLVFYGYRPEKEEILRKFGKRGAELIGGNDSIERWNRGEIPMLVAHPASAGHGLNLQHGGHTIVWTSPPWSLEHWQQGNKRLARSGQKHPVVVHVIVADETVDWLVIDKLQGKKGVQDALLSHLESPI